MQYDGDIHDLHVSSKFQFWIGRTWQPCKEVPNCTLCLVIVMAVWHVLRPVARYWYILHM